VQGYGRICGSYGASSRGEQMLAKQVLRGCQGTSRAGLADDPEPDHAGARQVERCVSMRFRYLGTGGSRSDSCAARPRRRSTARPRRSERVVTRRPTTPYRTDQRDSPTARMSGVLAALGKTLSRLVPDVSAWFKLV
jgi:hypothetical protein